MATEELRNSQRPIKERFEAGVSVIQSLPKEGSFQPSNAVKLRFYALYKQVKFGPCNIPKPGFWDPVGRAKWEAWNVCGTMSQDLAMRMYVEELQKFVETMPQSKEVVNFLKTIGPFYEIVDEEKEDGDEKDTQLTMADRATGEEEEEEEEDESSASENDEFQETFEDLPRHKSSSTPQQVSQEGRQPYDPTCMDKSQPLPPLREETEDAMNQGRHSQVVPNLDASSRSLQRSDVSSFEKNSELTSASLMNTSHPGLQIDSHSLQTKAGTDQTDGTSGKKVRISEFTSSSRLSQSKLSDRSPLHTSRVITQEHRRQQTPYVAGGNTHTQRKVSSSSATVGLVSESTSNDVNLVTTGQSGLSGATIQFGASGSVPLALQTLTTQLSHLQGNLQSMLQQLNTLAVAVHGLTQMQQQLSSSEPQVQLATRPQTELVPTLIMRRGRLLTICLRVVPMVIIWPVVVNIIMSFICRRFSPKRKEMPLPSWIWGVLTLLHSLMTLLQQYSSGAL